MHASRPLETRADAVHATWPLAAGEEAWIDAVWRRSYEPKEQSVDPVEHAREGARRLAATITYWKGWIARCWYDGPHAAAANRSALALKLMTYAPSGAIVAAPTTSLPEQIGGARNWDYRYCWIRDATLAMTSLMVLGFREEADDFKFWMERTGAGRPADLQIMYGIGGERALPEMELAHLRGHRDSPPVRIGNGAVKQLQLDPASCESATSTARPAASSTTATALLPPSPHRRQRCQKPTMDLGDPRARATHALQAQLLAVAHRAVQSPPRAACPGVRAGLRSAIACRVLLADGDQAGGSSSRRPRRRRCVDAAGAGPRVVSARHRCAETIAVVRLAGRDGLLYRTSRPTGAGGEGAFLRSFWLLDCLTHAGRLDEAEALLERLLGLANDVGLFAEQIDPTTGEALGNFPQAFSHMALVTSCAHLGAARRGLIPDGAHDYAELALDRLLASRASSRLYSSSSVFQ